MSLDARTTVRLTAAHLPLLGAVTLGVVLVGWLAVLDGRGLGGFATEPVGGAVLVLAALVCATGARSTAAARGWALASAGVLAGYALSAALAVSTEAPGFVALWGVAWIPPLALAQLTASAAVRPRRLLVPDHRLVLTVVGTTTLVALAVNRPESPFDGFAPLAPQAWRVVLAPVGDVVTVVGVLALLVLPVRLGRAAATSTGGVRAQLGVAAAGCCAAPLTVVFCLVLAVARNPGEVDPSTGSVAFLVALSACSVFALGCARLAAREVAAVDVLRTVTVVLGGAAALVVVAVGTVLAAPGSPLGPTTSALTIAALTVLAAVAAWTGSARLAASLVPTAVEVGGPEQTTAAQTSGVVAALTPRENEVLELLATGASNAGIAARLVISERTVDAHLRSVFAKLDLPAAGEGNRRVLAARVWFEEAARRG